MNNENNKPKTMARQILRGITITFIFLAGIFVLLVFIVPTGLSVFAGKDVKAIDDSNLELMTIAISKDENMYYDIKNVVTTPDVDVINKYYNKNIESDNWNESNVMELLTKKEAIFSSLDEAINKKSFQSPIFEKPDNISIDSIDTSSNFIREIVALTAVKAIWLAKNGKNDEAYNEALKIFKIGDNIEKSQCDLSLVLLSLSVKKTGIYAYKEISKISGYNQEQRKPYNDALQKYLPNNNDSFLKIDYLIQKKVVKTVASGENDASGIDSYITKNNFYFKPNMIINSKYKVFNDILEDYHSDCKNISKTTSVPREYSLLDIPKLYFTENAAGTLLSVIPETSLRNVKAKKCEINDMMNSIINE